MSRSQEVQPVGESDTVACCPAEFFRALDALTFVRTAFIQRCPGIDVVTDRETALTRLWLAHRRTADALGFSGMPFVLAEQVHGSVVARVDAPSRVPVPGADGLITSSPQLCLAIYVADCAAVYLADKKTTLLQILFARLARPECTPSSTATSALPAIPNSITPTEEKRDRPVDCSLSPQSLRRKQSR